MVDLQDKQEADNKVPASVFNIDELLLSNDRPPTKYGPIGQKSHTVSWSLTLNALSQIGEHRPLTNMLIDMSLKWDHLAAQSWNEMLSDSLIAKSDFQAINMSDQTYEKHLKNNKDRLQEINELIVINQNKVQHALNDLELSELGWQSFIQTMVSDYVIAYQSAPLTSAKMGKPDGRGEADANKYLDLLDQNYTEKAEKASDSSAIINDPHAVAQQYVHHDILLKKFKSEFTKEKINKYNKDTQKSIVELKDKAKKVIDQKQQTTNPTTLSQEDWDKMMTLLAVHEALKHMEVNWKLFQGKDYNSQYKRTAMASILHEWEQSIGNSYPNIKPYIFNSLKEYSDSMLISEGMQKEERNDNAANKDWKLEPTLKRDMEKHRKSHTDQRKHLLNKHQEDSSNLKKRSFLEAQKTRKQEDAASDMEQIAKHQKLNSESEDQQNQQDMLLLGSQSSTGSTIGQNNQLIGLPPANPLSAFSFTPPPSFNFNLNLTQLPHTFPSMNFGNAQSLFNNNLFNNNQNGFGNAQNMISNGIPNIMLNSTPSSLMNGSFQQQAQNDMMPALQTSAMEDIEEAEEEQQHKNDEGSMSNF
ncbi:hypothetical protein [Paenibacillus campi]|uniref:hypothetical protein n=1 Tax=Paenibacillus campi TaxID=3106031 RepID=UPI002AFFC455|nr:hypothetical protein [Paenibacillus sp. SGZ-1009]